MRPRVLLLSFAIAVLPAACTGSPTTTGRQPRSSAFDTGMGMGSGNRGDSTTTQKAPIPTEGGTVVAGTNAAVPGMGMGSGN